jgi:hypothetical protein
MVIWIDPYSLSVAISFITALGRPMIPVQNVHSEAQGFFFGLSPG